ncbi:hypothetical protein [Nonomuraea glycinis]|uniref:hypothetical protein n=1 Tax=Nonomuraea glycinis TaxID=2047744 RepID=UPI0033AA5A13
MHDELKVPSQRADDARDGTQDAHEDPTYRAPYAGTDDDMLVAADPDPRTGPHSRTDPDPGSPTTPEHDNDFEHENDVDSRTDPDHRTAPGIEPGAGTDSEAVIVTETGRLPADETPSHAAPKEIVLFDQDPAEAQARWRDLQASFVDDPGQAVHRADDLVEEVVEALTSSLTTRTGELRERWKSADGGDTEQLRLALRDYRGVLERLLALSEPNTR